MRSVRIAIWTSGLPVSPSARPCSLVSSALRSVVILADGAEVSQQISLGLEASMSKLRVDERPYYTAPLKRGEKVYALLREALSKSKKVGLAKVVIQTKQHLAVLIPCGRALILNLLRWGGEIRSFEQLDLPPLGVKAAGIKDAEMAMAMQLIEDMTQPWKADEFRNSFADEINKLVEIKANKGELADVAKVEKAEGAPTGANVLDLTALLKRSLGAARSPKEKPASVTELPTAKAAPAAKAAARKKPAAKKAAPASKASAKKPARRAA